MVSWWGTRRSSNLLRLRYLSFFDSFDSFDSFDFLVWYYFLSCFELFWVVLIYYCYSILFYSILKPQHLSFDILIFWFLSLLLLMMQIIKIIKIIYTIKIIKIIKSIKSIYIIKSIKSIYIIKSINIWSFFSNTFGFFFDLSGLITQNQNQNQIICQSKSDYLSIKIKIKVFVRPMQLINLLYFLLLSCSLALLDLLILILNFI